MTALHEQHCRTEKAPLGNAERRAALAQLKGWREAGGALEKTFAFAGWLETIAFVDALAWICHVEDHHPELSVSYDRCTVRFSTHSAGGVTRNDFVCAAKADALVAGR